MHSIPRSVPSLSRSPAIRRLGTGMLFSAALFLSAGSAFAQAASSFKMQVNGMVCSFCAQGIEKRLKAIPENGAIFIDLRNKVVAVEPRAGQSLNAERITTEVREAGYDVVAAETVPQTVAQIRAESRAARKER